MPGRSCEDSAQRVGWLRPSFLPPPTPPRPQQSCFSLFSALLALGTGSQRPSHTHTHTQSDNTKTQGPAPRLGAGCALSSAFRAQPAPEASHRRACPARPGPNAPAPPPGLGGLASLHSRHCRKENGGCAHLAGLWRVCPSARECSPLLSVGMLEGAGEAGRWLWSPPHRLWGGAGCPGRALCVGDPPTLAKPSASSPHRCGARPGCVCKVARLRWARASAPMRPSCSGLQLVPLGHGLSGTGDHVLPVPHLARPALPGQVDLWVRGGTSVRPSGTEPGVTLACSPGLFSWLGHPGPSGLAQPPCAIRLLPILRAGGSWHCGHP